MLKPKKAGPKNLVLLTNYLQYSQYSIIIFFLNTKSNFKTKKLDVFKYKNHFDSISVI